MNQVNEESKSRLLRVFAVLGFLAIIIIATWLAVQVVRLIPSAFSSLASLAESVEDGREAQNDILIESDDGVVNSSEALTINWSEVNRKGTYAFEYDCTEGVAVDLRINGAVAPVSCGERFTLPEGVFSLDALFTSERNRFSDVTYRISFTEDDEDEPFVDDEKIVTVVNASIPQGVVLGEEDEEEMQEDTDEPVTQTPAVSTPAPTPAPRPQQPRYRVTYQQPVSNPNGYTDLAVRMIAVGEIDDGAFESHDELEAGHTGAIQFEVQNIGTKTSTAWNFEVELPGGADYEPKSSQAGLKPKERATFTVVFTVPNDEDDNELYIKVSGGSDSHSTNNTLEVEVDISD